MDLPTLWGPVEVLDDQCYIWQLRDIWFWVRKRRDEWFVLLDREQAHAAAPPKFARTIQGGRIVQVPQEIRETGTYVIGEACETPQVGAWSRFVTVEQDTLQILPALPDRALVVRPFMKVSLLPGRWAEFFLTVPLWVSMLAGKGKSQTVFEEFPSHLLSNTWFGTTQAGELCYALHTALLRDDPGLEAGFDHAICPLVIRNTSNETLQFQRLCIHVENLELFSTSQGLVTNQIQVLFKGGDQPTQIDVQKKPHAGAKNPVRIREPRIPMSRSVLRRTFDVFKEITGL